MYFKLTLFSLERVRVSNDVLFVVLKLSIGCERLSPRNFLTTLVFVAKFAYDHLTSSR